MKNIVIAVIVIIALGVLGFFVFGSDESTEKQAENATSTNSGLNEKDSSRTLKDILTGQSSLAGDSYKCEFSSQVGQESVLDVITYVNGSKVRVDYTLNPPIQGQENMHMVSDGQYGYIWGDSYLGHQMAGMKIKIKEDDLEENQGRKPNQDNSMVNYDMPVVNCQPWTPESEKFEKPDNMEFKTMEESVSIPAASEGSSDNCAACDQLPTDQAQSCYQMMDCN